MCAAMARAKKKGRWLLSSRRERRPHARARKKNEEVKGDTSRAQEDEEFMEISPSETVMHVSPISVTKRLLAAFCSRDNSLLFFIDTPISQLKNYNRKVGTL